MLKRIKETDSETFQISSIMKLSQELCISFRKRNGRINPDGKATIMARIVINQERDGFSLGYKVEPHKFDTKSGMITGKTPEAVEINKHIFHVRNELIRHYNLLKSQGTIVTPSMLKNAYLGIGKQKRTLLEVIDFQNGKFAYMKHVHKLPDIPLERIEYAFADDFFADAYRWLLHSGHCASPILLYARVLGQHSLQ